MQGESSHSLLDQEAMVEQRTFCRGRTFSLSSLMVRPRYNWYLFRRYVDITSTNDPNPNHNPNHEKIIP